MANLLTGQQTETTALLPVLFNPKSIAVIGASRDETSISFGMGGKYVEILKDVSFRLAPITREDAREMIREVKAYEMLKGFRDIPAAGQEALENCLLRLSQLVTDFPEIKEIDLNPVFARKDGAVVVDARILL